MAKRNSRKRRGAHKPSSHREKGFDFSFQPLALAVGGMDLADCVRRANLVACAYGSIPDKNGVATPLVTLLGEHEKEVSALFAEFRRWGADVDGDVLDIHIILRQHNGYDLRLAPEPRRLLFRTMSHPQLFQPLTMQVAWSKHFDTTSPVLVSLKRYCEQPVHPVFVSGGTINVANPTLSQIRPLPQLAPILKLDLRIDDETKINTPDRTHVDTETQRKGPLQLPTVSPADVCSQRRQTINVLFPVITQRILRRDLCQRVREIAGFEPVLDIQVVQAAINIVLSNELSAGDNHYAAVRGDLSDTLWQHVQERTDIADGSPLRPLEPRVVAHQLDLDARTLLPQLPRTAGYPAVHQALLGTGLLQ
jgi:hypothetical protein